MIGKSSYSADGYEVTFATNYLGHFLLVNELLGSMAPNARFVLTASGTHDPDTGDGKLAGKAATADAFELANDGKAGHRSLKAGQRYTTSKLCLIMFAYELDRRLRKQNSSIVSVAYDPAFIPETGLTRDVPKLAQKFIKTRFAKSLIQLFGVVAGDLEFSGKFLGDIAVRPEFADKSGKYLQSRNLKLIEQKSSRASYDEQAAAKLWTASEKLIETALGQSQS